MVFNYKMIAAVNLEKSVEEFGHGYAWKDCG
jgi:hypothetical protein